MPHSLLLNYQFDKILPNYQLRVKKVTSPNYNISKNIFLTASLR
jgi:hypothetical protein